MAVTLSTKNLVTNPGAEVGPVSSSFSTDVVPRGWDVTGSFTGVRYDIGGGGDLNAADSLNLQGGSAYFAGGTNAEVSTANQQISLKGMFSQINSGGLGVAVSGQFGGFASQNDLVTLTVRFIGRDGVTELGNVIIAGPDAALRGSDSMLLFSENASFVPVGTRSLDVTITATRAAGTYNDGYADNIAVHLTGVSSGSVLVSEFS